MSQLIACLNDNGIVLAADAHAVDFEPTGEMRTMRVNRLFQLSSHTAVLTGGTPDGVEMCQALQTFIREEGLNDIQAVYAAALPFLASEFEQFMRKKCEVLPIDPVHHVYFVLGGYTEQDPQRPFRLFLLWTKKKLPQLDGDEISVAYTAPRLMGLEYRLSRLSQGNSPLEEILEEIEQNMERLAQRHEEIGPPFSYACITRDGFRQVQP
jgi:hypothetical protein